MKTPENYQHRSLIFVSHRGQISRGLTPEAAHAALEGGELPADALAWRFYLRQAAPLGMLARTPQRVEGWVELVLRSIWGFPTRKRLAEMAAKHLRAAEAAAARAETAPRPQPAPEAAWELLPPAGQAPAAPPPAAAPAAPAGQVYFLPPQQPAVIVQNGCAGAFFGGLFGCLLFIAAAALLVAGIIYLLISAFRGP